MDKDPRTNTTHIHAHIVTPPTCHITCTRTYTCTQIPGYGEHVWVSAEVARDGAVLHLRAVYHEIRVHVNPRNRGSPCCLRRALQCCGVGANGLRRSEPQGVHVSLVRHPRGVVRDVCGRYDTGVGMVWCGVVWCGVVWCGVVV